MFIVIQITKASFRLGSLEALNSIYKNWPWMFFLYVYIIKSLDILNRSLEVLISKFIDYDDWRTTDEFFNFMNQRWGPFTVDRFASVENKKLKRLILCFWNPGTERVNAFGERKTTGWFRQFLLSPVPYYM